MSRQIVLYDLPSKGGNHCWSLNPWKTRLLLNYKGIDYRTEWLEYPQIKPAFEKYLPPNPSTDTYTIPTIRLPDGSYIMDSKDIATQLTEKFAAYPSTPKLPFQTPILSQLETLIPDVQGALRPAFFPRVPRNILNEASIQFWHETRSKRVGMSLDQFEQEQGSDEKVLANVAPHLKKVTELFRQTPDGPFFEGKQVSYADFVWVSLLKFLQRIDEKFFQKFVEVDGKELHLALLEACQPWMERDNY